VHEMALDRVAWVERHVVAALHHARAAAFSEQALGRDGDVEIGIGLVRVQRRKQTGAAGAENQNVGLEAFEGHGLLATILILRLFVAIGTLPIYGAMVVLRPIAYKRTSRKRVKERPHACGGSRTEKNRPEEL